ncbi:Acb2/Tad1 domain-containing protein [Nocardia salmonicida]|uniref:Acb2/Tad1 domain-containing protein n=1 Tax=Nocardia salmonicida TaxID=53431 RepID=UPI00363AC3F3
MSAADIEHRFAFHAATTAEKRGEHGSVREACKALALFLDERVPDGREKALAITSLEQTMFWANAAIARQKEVATNG